MYRSGKSFSKYLLIATVFLLGNFSSFAQRISFDYSILRKIEASRTKKQNAFYKFISKYNNPVCLTGPAALLVSGLAKDNTTLTKKALFGVESVVSAEAVTFVLKFSIARLRPIRYDTTFTSVIPITVTNRAFPSGHVTEAFAMAAAMSIAVPKWYVVVPAYAWASLVSYSRVYLGVHYPTDVFGGAVVGSGTTYLMDRLNKWLVQDSNKRHHPRNEIFGTIAGIGGAYLLYKINDWIAIKKRKAIPKAIQ